MKTLLFLAWGLAFSLPPTHPDQNTGMIVIIQGCYHWQLENQRDVAAEIKLGEQSWSLKAKEKRYLLPPNDAPKTMNCTWADGLQESIILRQAKKHALQRSKSQ